VAESRRLLRNLVSLSTGEVTSRLIGFTAFALLARRLDPNQYGAVEFAVALALFFAMVVDFGLETIGARSISRNRNEVARLAAQIPAARLLLALVAVPVMGGVAIVSGQPETTVHLVWLFSIGLFAVPWFQRWLFQGLEMMDWVGNARGGARLAAKYLSRNEWGKLFERCGLVVEEERCNVSLYPWPASLLFERGLHFVARVASGALNGRSDETT